MKFFSKVKEGVASDHTLQTVRRGASQIVRDLPTNSVNYVLEKAPVVQWLPKYNPRWIINDILGGVTVGVLLIPQSLAYAKIATIPGEYGLMSSWLPNFIYFIMGTSKELSTGPTSLMGLLTAEIIKEVNHEGEEYSPQAIASAVAMWVGIYALIVGLFKLGFILDFISVPVLNGFISAVALTIMFGQIPSLFGVDVGDGFGTIIHDLLVQIPKYKPAPVAVGFSSIAILVILQKMGQRWGKKSKIIWIAALARSAIVLIIATGISYALNKNIDLENDDPIFDISKVKSNGINSPRMSPAPLITKVVGFSITPFFAAALEHIAIAKAFGRRNNYVIDQSQELVYLGVTNFFNSFFSSMSVGGAMSRTAVNCDTGVKSPLYGLVAGGFVLLAIFVLSPALFWVPKATLAAIIVTAVWHMIVSPKVFYGYLKTSLVDFIAAMLGFWVTLFVGTEIGIASAVGFNVLYHILASAFARARHITRLDQKPLPSRPYNGGYTYESDMPQGYQVFKFNESILFSNAYRVKTQCLDIVQTHNSGSVISQEIARKDRNWSVSGEQRVKRLRKKAGITMEPISLRVVVLDMSMVKKVDTTALIALKELTVDLEKFGGEGTELRFVAMSDDVRASFSRFGWKLYDSDAVVVVENGRMIGNVVYDSVGDAVTGGVERMVVDASDSAMMGEKGKV